MFINHSFSYFNKTLALHLVFSEQPLSLMHCVRARQYEIEVASTKRLQQPKHQWFYYSFSLINGRGSVPKINVMFTFFEMGIKFAYNYL